MSEQTADVILSHKFSGLNVRPLFKVLVNYIRVIGASLSEPHTSIACTFVYDYSDDGKNTRSQDN